MKRGSKIPGNTKTRESDKLFCNFRKQRRGLPCPTCGANMNRDHYAQGMAVYGCAICNKCYMKLSTGWTELAFKYEDFFVGGEIKWRTKRRNPRREKK